MTKAAGKTILCSAVMVGPNRPRIFDVVNSEPNEAALPAGFDLSWWGTGEALGLAHVRRGFFWRTDDELKNICT